MVTALGRTPNKSQSNLPSTSRAVTFLENSTYSQIAQNTFGHLSCLMKAGAQCPAQAGLNSVTAPPQTSGRREPTLQSCPLTSTYVPPHHKPNNKQKQINILNPMPNRIDLNKDLSKVDSKGMTCRYFLGASGQCPVT